MTDFLMPTLGADMEAGTLVEWHVAPGARVKRGDVVVSVETEKGIVEVEIWETGVISEILVHPGTKVPVGTVLARLRDERVPSTAAHPDRAPAPPPSPASPPPSPPSPPSPVHRTDGPSAPVTIVEHEMPAARSTVRASPAARQLAREQSIDLTKLRGTGPHEAITRDDVEHAWKIAAGERPAATSATAPSAMAAPPSIPSGMRRAIAAAMTRSKREIPHYYLSSELDVSRSGRWLDSENARRPVTERLLFAALLLKATALALRELPELNGFYTDEMFRPGKGIHVGVAIALRQGGLVAPAIHDTDQKTLGEIMARLQDLVTRARAGSLKSSELSDPTITVTNLGDQGTDMVLAVIYPPQVAIVGFGTMRERPWAQGGLLGVRPTIIASLAADHRVSDGHRGARFLAAIGRLLREPEKL